MAILAKTTLRGGCAALALSALAGCAVAPPTGPRSVAMPPAGKSYEQFTAEDQYCRQAAQYQVGPRQAREQEELLGGRHRRGRGRSARLGERQYGRRCCRRRCDGRAGWHVSRGVERPG